MEDDEGLKPWGYNYQDFKTKQNEEVAMFKFYLYFVFGIGKTAPLEMFNKWQLERRQESIIRIWESPIYR